MADRVSGLTPPLGELLQLIAVSPRGIALPVLRAAAQMDDEPLVGALDEGLHAGMLDEIRDANPVYRIRHELLRRTVYERVSSFRAAALHLRVGEALEAMPEGRRDRIVNELAFHFRAAAPIAGNGRAVEYALEAAAQAERSLAFAEAAGRFEEALALGVPDLPAEAEVRCRQGLAWHLAGRPAEALESFAAAAAAARECGDDALQARAAIGFETACWRPGIDDPRAVALLREAAAQVAAEPSAQRVRVAGAPEPRPRLSGRPRRGGRVLVAGGRHGPVAWATPARSWSRCPTPPGRAGRECSTRSWPTSPKPSSWRARFPTTPCPTSSAACASGC